jgi:UDP-N-acetylglucosamine 4,6-dehydratase
MRGNILITGGTGTLGRAVTKYLLANEPLTNIIIYSRDEYKQFLMKTAINDSRVEYVLGDVRDRTRVFQIAKKADYIIHAAALKHVWAGEQHPYEVLQTNISGTKNIVDAAREYNCTMVFVSSDKAVQPMNLYGCTKMAGEALTLNGNQRVCRYGNVFGSRGSVLHIFKQWAEVGHTFKITDKRMTRFVITIPEAVKLVLDTLMMPKGTLNIPTLPAIRIIDLAMAFDPEAIIEEIGIQKGEKLHESLSASQSSEDARKLTIPEIQELISATIG